LISVEFLNRFLKLSNESMARIR